jgi:hypothetical protein
MEERRGYTLIAGTMKVNYGGTEASPELEIQSITFGDVHYSEDGAYSDKLNDTKWSVAASGAWLTLRFSLGITIGTPSVT